MPQPTQFLIILDVDKAVDSDAVSIGLSDQRSIRHTWALTDFGHERRPGGGRDQLDWPRVTAALAKLDEQVRACWPAAGDVEVYVAGFAPLSVFFALGVLLDPRGARVVALQADRDHAGVWHPLPLAADDRGDGPLGPRGLLEEAAESTGHVGLFLSTIGAEVPKAQVRDAVQAHGDDLAGVASLTGAGVQIDDANVGRLVYQLRQFFVRAAISYPHRTGATVFLAGPATLAFAAGLALNPNQFTGNGHSIELTEYVGGSYLRAFRLPLEVAPDTSIPNDPESQLRRLGAFVHFKHGVAVLREQLDLGTVFMPAGFGGPQERSQGIARRAHAALVALCLPDAPGAEAFAVDGLTRTLTIGPGLLHPLAQLGEEVLVRLGQLFALHEIVHADQGIESHNYRGIGRSGVVLEDVDFWADAFAIGTAALHAVAQNGQAGRSRCGTILVQFIDAHIAAMRAFDQMEQGGQTLRVMPERRLRRYLIWYLQRARAQAVSQPQHIRALLDDRLVVELAPLRGRLDERYDKIVESGLQSTTLAFSIGGRARRVAPLPDNFMPSQLVEAVRAFDEQAINRAVLFVVNENRDLLAPWLV
ncbi:MAG: SAVED domain-containing protein [Deltaproteobacteria bacterium]|nr:SAVED domain-containing protein [Deltaproteobacteria bacterium]